MKAYSYVRFSSDKQQWGDSERRQEQRAKDWCARKNVPLAEVFAERHGVSAAQGKNRETGAFADLLKVVKSGDYILIEDNDRFGRDDAITALQALKEICLKGITVVFLTTGIEVNKSNFNDPAVIITNFMQAYLGNQENTKKSQRIGERWNKKRQAAANGVIFSRMAPAWLTVDRENNVFTPNANAKIVMRIFESYASGMPIRTIVKALNDDKVRPFRKSNLNGWSATHVRRVISSRSVIGEYQPHKFISKNERKIDGHPVPNYYNPIIPLELFYKCQEILSRNISVGGCKTNATNLFTGLVKCAHCGGAMNIKQSPKGKYYYTLLRCANAVNHAGCTYKNTIQYAHVERAVLSVLWSKVLPAMQEGNKRADALTAAKGELQSVESAIQNQMKAIDKIGIDEDITNWLANLKARKAILKSEIEKLEALNNDNPFLGWTQCEPTIENRLRLQNVLRGEIESLKVDAVGRKAWLTLKDPAVTFELAWNYQRANQVVKNPADSGFILTDLAGGSWNKTETLYVDKALVWKTENIPQIYLRMA
ncbi:MAG: Recombinase [Pedosphaera sp.]|nr:Recombinase [Pedosphaera sp.]